MLTTRCPHCGTAFRVKPEQLRARGGRVRCGHCKAPFSALEGLVEGPVEELASSDAPVSAPQPQVVEVASPPEAVAPVPVEAAHIAEVPAPPVWEPEPEPVATPAPAVSPPPPPVLDPVKPLPPPKPVVRREVVGARVVTAPMVAPIPELEPSAPRHGAAVSLDFDLDSSDFKGAAAVAPEREDGGAQYDTEVTQLAVEWREHESDDAQVDLAESDWRGGRSGRPAPKAPTTEMPLEPEKDQDARPEPLFITAFASPQGSSSKPIWPAEPSQGAHEEAAAEGDDEALKQALEARREQRRAELARAKGLPVPPAGGAADHEPMESDDAHPYWVDDAEPRPRTWPWAAGVLLFGLIGAGQAMLWLRHDVAREFPHTRPFFEAACEELGCAMPWPRVPAQISVEATDMHPPATKDGAFELTGTLRNRAGFAQSYPYLEITLTDVYNRALVRRALKPEEWLPSALRGTQAFAPNTDIVFTVTFDAREQPASGYNLYAFYP